MLTEIREITNVGTFHGFRPDKPVELRKLTLIYGPNGTGKTTLCAILRSLARNEPDLLVGRKTLNREGESRVELGLSDGGRCVWDGTAWSGDPPKIEIFDEQFVRDNLYTDTVEVEQKRNLLQVILGEHDAKIAKKVSKAARVGRKLQNRIRTLEREIDALVRNRTSMKDFVELNEDPEIDSKIDEQRKRVAAHENAEQLQRQRGLELLPLPEPLEGLEVLLGRTFEELSEDAEQSLQRHLERCGGELGHREWLEQGLRFAKDDICPFCGQSVSGVELVHAYRAVFSERYRVHKAEIEAMLTELERRFGSEASARFAAIVANNAERARFWEPYVTSDWSILNARLDWKEAWEGYYSAARAALDRKRSSPLERVSAEDLRQLEERLRVMLEGLRERNRSIAPLNSEIENVKNAARSDQVETARNELDRLGIVKKRHLPEVAALCKIYLSKLDCKYKVEERRRALQRELDERSPDKLGACARRVNEILGSFNAGFVLHEIRKEQPSGDAAAGWKVAIRGEPIHPGEERAPREPNFKNTLSGGDRSALAFAFFLAQLEQKPDLGERIVVLDDPFTSQDSHREHVTRTMIESLRHKVNQVIVLSHQPRFVLSISERAGRNVPLSELEIGCTGDSGSFLKKTDLERLVTDRFRLYEGKMISYFKVQEGDPIEIAEGLRTYIEQRLKTLFLQEVEPGDTLGSILRKLEDATKLEKKLLSDLREVNDYCNRWHHATGMEGDTEAPDPAELRGMIRRTLDVFSAIYKAAGS